MSPTGVGKAAENELNPRFKEYTRDSSLKASGGMVPCKLLPPSDRIETATKLPTLEGMVPDKPLPARSIPVTTPEEQCTPLQVHTELIGAPLEQLQPDSPTDAG